jgi:6-phosphogluconolactonase (cycloisomerase 2 family)
MAQIMLMNTLYQRAFDVSTASFTDAFSIAAQDAIMTSLTFSPDGTKMFITGNTTNSVYAYDLSTGFDVSTASYTNSFSLAAQGTGPRSIAFNTTGTKMFVVTSSTNEIDEYSLSTGFNVTTASFTVSFSVASQDTTPQGLTFNADGTNMFLVGQAGQDVNRYALSTAFDVSTASFADNLSVASQDTSPKSITFNSDGTKMYITGEATSPASVYQYSTAAYPNQMDKTQLDAVTDPNHIALGDDLDLAIVFNMTSGTTVPSSDGVAINYDANVLNKGAVLGTDYDFDAPTTSSVRITALTANNLKVRVV